MLRRHALIVTALALLLVASPVLAEEAVRVELVANALVGRAKPRLVVHVVQPVAGLRLTLARADGGKVTRSVGRLVRGAVQSFELDQPPGTVKWEGELVADLGKGSLVTFPLAFETSLRGPPKIVLSEEPVDLVARVVRLSTDRDAPTVTLKVTADDGTVIAEEARPFPEAKAGALLEAKWLGGEGAKVLRIDVRVADQAGFFQDLELYPWKFEIPHEDVLFATGKAEIAADEQPKLEAALTELQAAIARYGRFARVQLFVEGHTDTVGDAASNRALSEARAQAIARWFRKKGAKLPIHFAGRGEDRLLVETADDVDEPRNRRAAYIVSVQNPGGTWTRLP